MSTMELDARKSEIIRQLLDIDSDDAISKLEQYLRKIRLKSQEKEGSLIAPMMNVTESEFDNRIQKAVDDDDVATDEEVSQFYERWLCEK